MEHILQNSMKVSMIFTDPVKDWIPPSCLTISTLERPLRALARYVKNCNYEGADPLDGVSSKWLEWSPVKNSQLAQQWISRLCQQSTTNWRPLLLIPQQFTPLSGALFLQGYLNLVAIQPEEVYENETYILFQRLKHLRMARGRGSAWGKPYPWQSRTIRATAHTPDLLSTAWVGRAMLAYYERFQEKEALTLALEAADFLQSELLRAQDSGFCYFRYVAGQETSAHSINLTGAAFLGQVLPYLAPESQISIREKILAIIRFSMVDIENDGSWPEGIGHHQRHIRHNHTASCLSEMLTLYETLGDAELLPLLKQVAGYYLFNLYTEEGFPCINEAQKPYPTNLLTIAQAITVMHQLRKHQLWIHPARLSQIENALLLLIQRFQDAKGFFYYQQQSPKRWNRIPYMHPAQAAMFYALSSCLENIE